MFREQCKFENNLEKQIPGYALGCGVFNFFNFEALPSLIFVHLKASS